MRSLADKYVFAFDAGVEILYLLAFSLTHPGCCWQNSSCTSMNINTLCPDTLLWCVSISLHARIFCRVFFLFLHVQLPVTQTNMLLFVAFWQRDYCVHIIWESSSIMKNSDLDFPNFYFCAVERKWNAHPLWCPALLAVLQDSALFFSLSGLIVVATVLYFHLLWLRYNCLAFITWPACYWLQKNDVNGVWYMSERFL